MDYGCKSDDTGNQSCLRTNTKNDAFHPLFRVSPVVESLEGPKRLVR